MHRAKLKFKMIIGSLTMLTLVAMDKKRARPVGPFVST